MKTVSYNLNKNPLRVIIEIFLLSGTNGILSFMICISFKYFFPVSKFIVSIFYLSICLFTMGFDLFVIDVDLSLLVGNMFFSIQMVLEQLKGY